MGSDICVAVNVASRQKVLAGSLVDGSHLDRREVRHWEAFLGHQCGSWGVGVVATLSVKAPSLNERERDEAVNAGEETEELRS